MTTNPPNVLKSAALHIQNGDLQSARVILARYLKEKGNDANAWSLLSLAVEGKERQIYCLERALHLDPDHSAAQERLLEITGVSDFSEDVEPLLPRPASAVSASGGVAAPPEVKAKPAGPGIYYPSLAEIEEQNQLRLRMAIWLHVTWRRFKANLRVFMRNPVAVVGIAILVVFTIMVIVHPVILGTVWPVSVYDPVLGFDLDYMPHPNPPVPGHLFGTDTLGRDVLSMLMAATRPAYVLAITAAFTTAVISTCVGAFSAYYRSLVDGILSHVSDLALLTPAPLVMVVIGGVIDVPPFYFGLLYGLISGLGGAAIVMRSQALTILTKPFIDASRIAGAGSLRIIFRHLIPHMLPLAAVQMLLVVTGAVFADGFIAFLGLTQTKLSWGTMIYQSFTFRQLNGVTPWNVLIPSSLAISLFAASFYMIARGLHDVAEPRLRER